MEIVMDIFNKTSKAEAKQAFEMWLDNHPEDYEVGDDDVRAVMFEHDVADVRALKGWLEDYVAEDVTEYMSVEDARNKVYDLGLITSKSKYKELVDIYKHTELNHHQQMPSIESYLEHPKTIAKYAYDSILNDF